MVKINKKQKELYADKILDLTNIAVGALVFGQLIADRPFSWPSAIFGGIVLFMLYFMCFIITQT